MDNGTAIRIFFRQERAGLPERLTGIFLSSGESTNGIIPCPDLSEAPDWCFPCRQILRDGEAVTCNEQGICQQVGTFRRTLSLPLIWKDQNYGALTMTDREWDFGEEDRLLLEAAREVIIPALRVREEEEKIRAEREEFTRHLETVQRLETMSNLGAGIAHDFNNVLAAILGFADLREMDLPEGSEARDHAGEIVRAASRGRDLARQVLTFARPNTRERSFVQMGTLINETIRIVRGAVADGIQIESSLPDPAPGSWGDPTRLQQLPFHLLMNAAQALDPGTGRIFVRLEPDGSGVLLQVKDNGPVIPEAIRGRIYEPNFTTRRNRGGTGLGLASVHGIVRAHQGSIQLETATGQGTSFRIRLPEGNGGPDREESAAISELLRGTERVVLVDDDEDVLQVLEKQIQRLGYAVSSFADPRTALEHFRAAPDGVDLLISDLSMPQMAGTALVFEMRAIRPELPVLICTGYADETLQGENCEFWLPLLRKPVRYEMLARQI